VRGGVLALQTDSASGKSSSGKGDGLEGSGRTLGDSTAFHGLYDHRMQGKKNMEEGKGCTEACDEEHALGGWSLWAAEKIEGGKETVKAKEKGFPGKRGKSPLSRLEREERLSFFFNSKAWRKE